MPTVTVLMTVYNGLPYLPEAIESILNQSYRDFEFLIIDDGSTDGSIDCVLGFSDPRIRFLKNEQNIGQAASLNRGLKEARGKYIARIDQDDLSLEGRLEKQVDFLDLRPDVTTVGCWGYRIDSKGGITGHRRDKVRDAGDFIGQLLVRRCPLLHPGVMFRRETVALLGGYDPTFAPSEDFELWARLAARGYRAYVLPEWLIKYRVHEGQQSATQQDRQRTATRRAHQNLVYAFCPDQTAEALGMLLRVEHDFLKFSKSGRDLNAVVRSLQMLTNELARKLSLNFLERSSVQRILLRWIGPVTRCGGVFRYLPIGLARLAFLALCPLLIPRFRPIGERFADSCRRVRYVRVLGNTIERGVCQVEGFTLSRLRLRS